MKITTTVEITDSQAAGVLCCALEGGSNYWYCIEDKNIGEMHPDPTFEARWGAYVHSCPFRKGGWLRFSANADNENEEVKGKTRFTLDRAAIERGLQLMAKRQPHHFADILNKTDDATTGDIFLQLALFGELVYG